MAIIQPLDLEMIFVNTFAEGWMLFMALAFAAFSFLAAKFRMPNGIYLILMFIFVVFISSFYSVFYGLVILIAGLFVATQIKKVPGG